MIILSSYLLPKMQPLVLSYTCACVTENIRLFYLTQADVFSSLDG